MNSFHSDLRGTRYLAKCGAVPYLPRVTERGVAHFEQTLDIRLPEDYREFLLEWNGVWFNSPANGPEINAVVAAQEIDNHTPRAIPREQWPPHSWLWSASVWQISELYGIGDEPYLTLSKTKPGYGFEVWAPPRFLAIGCAFYGKGRLCVSLSGDDRGQIYMWRWPEDPPLDDEILPNMRCMDWVAANFRDFWDVLVPMTTEEMIDKWI